MKTAIKQKLQPAMGLINDKIKSFGRRAQSNAVNINLKSNASLDNLSAVKSDSKRETSGVPNLLKA